MADTYDTIVTPSRILNNGGEVTYEQYKGDGAQTWKRGQLVEMTSGAITEVVDNGSAVEIDTDDTGTSGAILFVAVEDVTVATGDTVAVQRITSATEFIGPLVSTQAAQATPPTAPSTIVQTDYALLQDTNGWFAPDKNDELKPVVIITGVEATDYPYGPDDAGLDMYVHSSSDTQKYNFVRFKFLAAVISDQ